VTLADPPFAEAVIWAELLEVNAPVDAVKLADEAPAGTDTDAGTVRFELLSLNTTVRLAGVAFVSATVQAEEEFGPSVVGLHARVETRGVVTRLMVADAEPPFAEAVICAELSAVNAVAVAVKLADEAPAATETEAGSLRFALLSLSVTVSPEVGALVSPSVQVEDPLGARVAGLHARVETLGVVTRLMVADAEPPFAEAVICAELSAVNAVAVAVKLADEAPAATGTEAGSLRLELLSLRATVSAPGVTPVSVTVQDEVPLGPMLAGLQVRP
jgi:hypothetical protein